MNYFDIAMKEIEKIQKNAKPRKARVPFAAKSKVFKSKVAYNRKKLKLD